MSEPTLKKSFFYYENSIKENWKNLLSKLKSVEGFRLTSQLKLILEVIYLSNDHPSAEEIYLRAKLKNKNVSKATVYRTVRKLTELKIIEQHDFGLGKAHYEILSHHHHHLIDTTTGVVIEFKSQELENLKEKIAKDMGYKLIGHRLDMYGIPLSKKEGEE